MQVYALSEKYSKTNAEQGEEKAIKLPPIDDRRYSSSKLTWNGNPFALTNGLEWIDLCQKDKMTSIQLRRDERMKTVYEQRTSSTRHRSKAPPAIKTFLDQIDKEIEMELKGKNQNLRKHALTATQRLHVRLVERESTQELIRRKREMFLVNFALQTKKNEISGYRTKEAEEEVKVNQMGERLRKEALSFDEFLKATDLAAAEAMKNAEKETRLKIEKAQEVRRMQTKLTLIKGDISKQDELLSEHLGYKCFLLRFHYNMTNKKGINLTNEQWLVRREIDRKMRGAMKRTSKGRASIFFADDKQKRFSLLFRRQSSFGSALPKYIARKPSSAKPEFGSKSNRQTFTKATYPEEWDEDERDSDALTERLSPLLKNTKSILNVIYEKEEENLKLIYRFQSSLDALDELKVAHKRKMMMLDKEIVRLTEQVGLMKRNIFVVEEKSEELQTMCRLLGVGAASSSEDGVGELHAKVEMVYLHVFGQVIVNIDALAMLTCIEKKMDLLIEELESLPEEAVQEIQKAKDRERRLEQRTQKILEHRKKQDERTRRALERANKNSKKKIGRKLMFRSQPARWQEKRNTARRGVQQSESEQFLTAD